MAWFKVDDGFHSSRKLLSIQKRHRLAAAGLWVIAGSWCADQLTDGHVPGYMLKEWGATPATIKALVDSGLWEQIDDANLFYNWHEYQPSKQDVDAERAASRERMRDLRAKRKQPKPREQAEEEGLFGRTVPNSSENVRNPDPTRPDPTKEPNGSSGTRKRAHRLPDAWAPDGDLVQAMILECPNVDQRAEHRKFIDYWQSQPDSKARKTDWNATYRNWIRRANETAPKSANRATDRMRAGYDAMAGYTGPQEDPWTRKELEA